MSWISRLFGRKPPPPPNRDVQIRSKIGHSIDDPNCPRNVLENRYRENRDFDTIKKIQNHPTVRGLITRAANSINPIELADLARSPIHDVRLVVAKNSSSGGDILRGLALSAQRELEDNSSLPWRTQINKRILGAVAGNENAPADILENLTNNRSLPNVRRSGALNPKTPWRAVADYLIDTGQDEVGFDVDLAVDYFIGKDPLKDTLGSQEHLDRIEYLLSLVEALAKRSAGDRENIEKNLPPNFMDALKQARELKQATKAK